MKCGGISVQGAFLLPVYYLQLIFAIPFQLLQYLFFSRRIKRSKISKDPVFILGHYRSGTTYLQKLIASDKRFGCITNYDALFPNSNLLLGQSGQTAFQFLINVFRIKNPFFHSSIVQLSEPAEEDDYLMNKASSYTAYWGLIFPKRWREWLNGSDDFKNIKYIKGWENEYLKLVKYATFKNNGKQLILKNPPNTGRIRMLLQLFPNAKFIYMYRNPYHLYYSTKNMWSKAILNYYSLQKISANELDEIVFEHFSYLVDQYQKDKNCIPPGNLIEISYEDLKSDPFSVVQRLYQKLNLPNFEFTANDLLKQLEREKGYQNFEYRYDKEDLDRIAERWGKYLSDYPSPAATREMAAK